MVMLDEKKCFKCGEVKPLTEFYAHKQMADGHLNKCKECTKKYINEYRAENLEAVNAYDSARYRGFFVHKRSASRPMCVTDIPHLPRSARGELTEAERAQRKSATVAVNNAVRDGRLVKPVLCSRCDEPAMGRQRIEAHHEDYAKPLDVVWLCTGCHKLADRERVLREIESRKTG